MSDDTDCYANPYQAATMLPPGPEHLDAVRQFLEDEQQRLHNLLTGLETDDGSIPAESADEWSVLKGRLDQTRVFHSLVLQTVILDNDRSEADNTPDGPPPEDFDYGDRRPDGQYENYPTIDGGEFEQAIRETYIHVDGCGSKTTMTGDLQESVARDPSYYSKTFCSGCGEHVPVDEVEWDDGHDWVVKKPDGGGA